MWRIPLLTPIIAVAVRVRVVMFVAVLLSSRLLKKSLSLSLPS
jgi:hypothetical protein